MRLLRRRSARAEEEAKDIAMHAARHPGGGYTAAVVSIVALAFSAYSLWETSLKQADLSVYIPGVVSYTRDTAASVDVVPWGGFEVFAVPVTIANSGARDAPVLAMTLEVKNLQTGLTARFEATYTAEPSYFNPDPKSAREKAPFSALVIAGRSAWRGTVLFYPVSYSNGKSLTSVSKLREFNEALRAKYGSEMSGIVSIDELRKKNPELPEIAEYDAFRAKVMNQNDKIEATLELVRPRPSGWLDRLLESTVPPIALTLQAPAFSARNLEAGELVRVRWVRPEA